DESNQEPLWQALASGSLQVVATDHSAWPIKDHKDQSLDDFRYIIQGAADILVWDPSVEWTLSVDGLHGNTDYTTFEGMPVQGAPAAVLSRGRVVVRD